MQFKNSPQRYGLVSITLHWGMAIAVIAMFALGLWMRSLGYYDPWYREGPYIHKSVGIILLVLLVLRLIWRFINPSPKDEPGMSTTEKRAAHGAHYLLYLLLFLIMISGYLISTADGRAISVFDWFEVPALISGIKNQEDLAGLIHEYLAYGLIGLVVIHALAAFKHHFINKDQTLNKMLGRKS